MVMELYNSEVIPIDFRKFQTATMHINKHVMKRSYGHVLKVTNDLSVDTLLALVNFISFDGKVGCTGEGNHRGQNSWVQVLVLNNKRIHRW